MLQKLKILFVSTGDSCRSQMAQGWAQHLKGDLMESCSAGIESHGWNTYAVGVMAEAGVDISRCRSKTLQELSTQGFDFVITLCDHAHEVITRSDHADESFPILSGKAKVLHVGFEDPPRLAAHETSPVKALDQYRRVRDEIKAFVMTLPNALIKLS